MSGAFLGLWRLNSREFFFPYDRPQDCGNREGAYRVALSPGMFDSLIPRDVVDQGPYTLELTIR